MEEHEETVLLRYAPRIAGIGIADLLRMVRDRRLRYARIEGEICLYVEELRTLQQA